MNIKINKSKLGNEELEMKKDKRAKFIELGEKRVANTIKSMRLIGNLADKSNYSYSDEDVSKISKVLRGELNAALSRFNKSDSKKVKTLFTFND